jgi:Tol biopolymer transport system component
LAGLVARPVPSTGPAEPAEPVESAEPVEPAESPVAREFAAIVGDDTVAVAPDDTATIEVDLVDRGLTAPQDIAFIPPTPPDTGDGRPRRGVPPSYLIVALIVVVAGASVWLLIDRRAGGGSGGGASEPDDRSSAGAPVVAASPSAAPSEPAVDVIAFVSDRSGTPEVWTMNVDATDVRQVTDTRAAELVHPDWSPDGQQIVFASNATGGSNADGDMEIWTVNADGTDLRQLTDNVGVRDAAPDWSPDGTRIAFSSARSDSGTGDTPDEDLEIWIMNSADGQNEQRLTDNDHDDDTPDWSPDGRQIVWETNPASGHDIFRMNADGSGKTEVYAGPGADFWPMWSPDGDRIAYRSDEQSGGSGHDILTVTLEGEPIARLTADAADNHRPNWSPDGGRLTFDKAVGAGRDIFVVPAGGGDAQRLTDDPAADHSAAWRPSPTAD